MVIFQAQKKDTKMLASLAVQLWPNHTQQELEEEFSGLMEDGKTVFFLCEQEGKAAGFAQCSLRNDYVEGTESSPVGYLEGIFVCPAYRKQGYARRLLSACESWAERQGCLEFASDCELHNKDSLHFHLQAGFVEANRIICFVKQLHSRNSEDVDC